jgi:hypothetical protein
MDISIGRICMIKKVLKYATYIGYYHEGIHYGAARLLGVRARMCKWRIDLFGEIADDKLTLITLAPFIVYFTCLMLTTIEWIMFKTLLPGLDKLIPAISREFFYFILFWLSSILTCSMDLVQYVHFLITGKWYYEPINQLDIKQQRFIESLN